jgi:hypothetical protein
MLNPLSLWERAGVRAYKKTTNMNEDFIKQVTRQSMIKYFTIKPPSDQ